ncbi:unnamed protein product, partial [Linum tenue]
CPTDDSSLFQFVVGAHLQPPSFFHRGNLLAVPASPPFSILLLFPARESVSKRGVEGVPYLTLPSPSSNSLSSSCSTRWLEGVPHPAGESRQPLPRQPLSFCLHRHGQASELRWRYGIRGSAEGNLEARAGTMKISISMDATYRPQRLEKGITKHPGKCSLDSPFRIHYLGPCCFSLQEGRKEVRQTGCQ